MNIGGPRSQPSTRPNLGPRSQPSTQPNLEELRRLPFLDGIGNLVLAAGSVLDFKGDAMVNAANEGCIGGFGVDEMVNKSGGPELKVARRSLGGCPTGQARVTSSFDHINTKIIVHAVGPVYRLNRLKDGEISSSSHEEQQAFLAAHKDPLLSQAYKSALTAAYQYTDNAATQNSNGGGGGGRGNSGSSNSGGSSNTDGGGTGGKFGGSVTSVGFCLLSAGVFRGQRSLTDLCRVGVEAILSWGRDHHSQHSSSTPLREVWLIAYTREEEEALLQAADAVAADAAAAAAAAAPAPSPQIAAPASSPPSPLYPAADDDTTTTTSTSGGDGVGGGGGGGGRNTQSSVNPFCEEKGGAPDEPAASVLSMLFPPSAAAAAAGTSPPVVWGEDEAEELEWLHTAALHFHRWRRRCLGDTMSARASRHACSSTSSTSESTSSTSSTSTSTSTATVSSPPPRGENDTSGPAGGEEKELPTIPKIVHHIWLGGALPPKFEAFRSSWQTHHPASKGWRHVLWDDGLVRTALTSTTSSSSSSSSTHASSICRSTNDDKSTSSGASTSTSTSTSITSKNESSSSSNTTSGSNNTSATTDSTDSHNSSSTATTPPTCHGRENRAAACPIDPAALRVTNKDAFFAATNFGEKSDILRYEILNQFGGVYVDTDFECLAPLDDLHSSGPAGVAFYTGFSHTRAAAEVNNGLIACVPKHPIVAAAVRRIRAAHARSQALALVSGGPAHLALTSGFSSSNSTSNSSTSTSGRNGSVVASPSSDPLSSSSLITGFLGVPPAVEKPAPTPPPPPPVATTVPLQATGGCISSSSSSSSSSSGSGSSSTSSSSSSGSSSSSTSSSSSSSSSSSGSSSSSSTSSSSSAQAQAASTISRTGPGMWTVLVLRSLVQAAAAEAAAEAASDPSSTTSKARGIGPKPVLSPSDLIGQQQGWEGGAGAKEGDGEHAHSRCQGCGGDGDGGGDLRRRGRRSDAKSRGVLVAPRQWFYPVPNTAAADAGVGGGGGAAHGAQSWVTSDTRAVHHWARSWVPK